MPTRLIKKFLGQFDMFPALATFRTDGQPQTSNSCGGILSLIILIVFIYVFISQFVQVANWQQIQSVLTQNNTFDSSRSLNNFMVGVGMQNLRIQGITQYMRFQILEITKNGSVVVSTRTLITQKCTLEHIADLGDQAQTSFDSFNLKNKLCLALNQNYTIQQPSDGVYSMLVVQVNPCNRKNQNGTAMYSACADQNFTLYRSQIWANTYKYFVADVVYINTAFNPLSQTPTAKFMQSVRLTFTANLGSQAFVYLSTYQVATDVSIFPMQQIQKQTGYSKDSIITNNCEVIWYFQLASCSFLLSSTSILINRTVGKLDQVLSYAGGLFGIIISFLSFFMMSFNKCRYQIMAAQSAFKCNQDGEKIREEDFNFFVYIKYTIFDWVNVLTCYQIPWKDCLQINQTLGQAVKQLDISLMFKKIQYFERFIQYIMTDKQKIGLFLTQPPSIQSVRKKRMIAQYYDKIIKGKPAVTIFDFNIANGIFQFANKKLVRKDSNSNNSNSNLNGLTSSNHNNIKNTSNNSSYNNNSNNNNNLNSGQSNPTNNLQQIQNIFLQRQDFLQNSIAIYQQNIMKQQQEQDQYQLNQQQLQVEKHIAMQIFTIADPIKKKYILSKIPLKILRRLYRIKNNVVNGNQVLINLEI